ncbi:hypothetical protein [Scytonema sp. UIC 10036]|uniref:O-linked N-acetylglucosamine transferase, SPINDLY family protein n=1 Tax=Scytonema sp. UIC 10036 TaxID=2304196 RepID=UPI00140F7DF9|nr:hypothetical protein [Scytonema sp. UIC 10036]
MSESKKILFFSPYSAWLLHSQVDAVMAKALEMRDCDVLSVICDGVYRDCYITRGMSSQQALNSCQSCSQLGQRFFDSFGLPYLQLRDFILPDDYAIANLWIETVDSDDYANATYQELPIGKWVTSSIYTYFRISPHRLSMPNVRKIHRQYLMDGLITYQAVSRLLDTHQPTNLFLFNARLAPYRIAFEVARQRQIDTIVHERGYIADSFSFFDNCSVLSTKPPLDCVRAWKNIPLKESELLQVKKYFTNREAGLNLSWPSFYDFKTNYAEVRQKLRIPANAKIFTVFTSSEDELRAFEDYAGITEQLDIIDRLINIFADRDEYLVVRHHPLIAGDKFTPPDTDLLTRAYHQALLAPKNVRIVMPSEQLTSYALLWNTEAAIAFFSTISIESAARGVPTASFKISPYHQALRYVIETDNLSTENLKMLVDELLAESARSTVEDMRNLYRFTHAFFFKFSTKFRAFGVKDSHFYDLRFQSLDELQPGNDPSLDRICNRILNGSFLYDLSDSDDTSRSLLEEENFLQQELLEVKEFSQKVREQALVQNNFSSEPKVSVIYLHYKGEEYNNELLQNWLERSRYKNIVLHCCSHLDWENYQDVIDSIITILKLSKEDYVLVVNNQFQYDESFISSALDILLADGNEETLGVLFGAWLASSDNEIQQQIFTQYVPVSSYHQALEILPSLQYPQTLLSFALMRSQALVSILNTIKQIPIASQAAESLFTLLNGTGIYKTKMPMLVLHESESSELLSTQIFTWVTDYQTDPSNKTTLANLLQARKDIADLLLGLNADRLPSIYLGDTGKAYQILVNSGIQYEPLTETEQGFVAETMAHTTNGFGESQAIQYLLVAMLYYRPHQLPLACDLTRIPSWLLKDYLKFTLHPPLYFEKRGEVDSYYQYMQQLLNDLHSNILSNPDSELWLEVAGHFTRAANFIPLYFNQANLKDIYTKRADIMEFFLTKIGSELEYEFPERSLEFNKIRLGVLASHFGPQTETFAALPVYKHLNRDLFEIILFTFNVSNHRLESYCVSHADAFVKLPSDLVDQVQIIREAELDILFISTNVTAVNHQITLLALHRLAPVQMVDANSPVSTGMRHVDYYISSKLSEPEENAQQHYSEKLITLNSPPQCFDFATEEQILPTTPISRESLGIDKTTVVYISGANYFKIIPEVEVTWAKIIANVPNSVLLLYPFNPNWASSYPYLAFRKRIVATFAEYGLSEDKLIILDPLPNRADIKELLKLANIYLDSYPYSGMTSLIDPLEVSLPTVVMEAEPSRSQKGASLLRELELPDLIANNEATYIQLAVDLGTDCKLRQQKSDRLLQRMQANPIFLDSRSFSAQIKELFRELFRKHQVLALTEHLKLKDINLMIFPDWSQPEELLCEELEQVIGAIATHSNSENITLLVDISQISYEEAELLLSGVTMNLLMQDLDVSEGLEISLLGDLSEIQWQVLLPRIQARIVLEKEDKQALAQVQVEKLLAYNLDSYMVFCREIAPV